MGCDCLTIFLTSMRRHWLHALFLTCGSRVAQHKVHRIPVVDYNTQVVGIVTRTDIFTALALNEGSPELLTT